MDVQDRRKQYRLRIRMSLRIEGEYPDGGHFGFDTETIDVSLEGVSFRSKQDLKMSQPITVSVPGKCRLRGRVAWVGGKDEEGYRQIGAQLLPPIINWVIR